MTPKRILVIDDEYQITRVLKRSLGAHRYDVRTAADGESGLDLFRDFHPDLVITDLSMPEMNGIEVCRAIRKSSEIPIIVLSVRGEERVKVEALDAGADKERRMNNRRLIEDSLPLGEISKYSAAEKSIRQGNISTLHLWWARRPLAAARAATLAALLPAPKNSDERQRLHDLIAGSLGWDWRRTPGPFTPSFVAFSA